MLPTDTGDGEGAALCLLEAVSRHACFRFGASLAGGDLQGSGEGMGVEG